MSRIVGLALTLLLSSCASKAPPAATPAPTPAKEAPEAKAAPSELPAMALVVVMDTSGSMVAARKIKQAQAGAIASLHTLAPESLFGLVTFDSQSKTVVPLQPVEARQSIEDLIATITPAGGTNIYPGLEQAHQLLQSVKSEKKHVIILSDGHAPPSGLRELALTMRAQGITISAVGIGDFNPALMHHIAQAGGGVVTVAETPTDLPTLFAKETRRALEEPVQ